MPYKHDVTGSSPVVPTICRHGSVVQLVRTPACHAGGRGFKSLPSRHYAFVAQLVEQRTENPRVTGSIPVEGTTERGAFRSASVAHLVERHLAKVEVASSSLVTRSKTERSPLRSVFSLL